jgi:hypothetical protein
MVDYPILKRHPHEMECDKFHEGMESWKMLEYVNGEILWPVRFPETTTAGNIVTGEQYDVQDFRAFMAIKYCPFCGKRLRKKGFESYLEQFNECVMYGNYDFSEEDGAWLGTLINMMHYGFFAPIDETSVSDFLTDIAESRITPDEAIGKLTLFRDKVKAEFIDIE